jgi:glycosyltransferase involved in cell wall biosynthesis
MKPCLFNTSVIIPTYNRPTELKQCIQSILDQTVKPGELIIVDDGNLLELPLEKQCLDGEIQYIYFKKSRPGLTESRNEGIKLARGDIIFFLDDDVALFPNYIEEILNIYQEDKEEITGGVGGVIASHRPLKFKDRLRRVYNIFFLISGLNEGKLLPSGFCVNFGDTGSPIKKTTEVDFLSGGASSFRKKVFKDFSFDTKNYINYGLGEDKDFSCHVSRKYKLMINPKAKLLHFESPKMRPDKLKEGRMFIMASYIRFRQHVKKGWWSWLFFYYALSGYILARMVAVIFFPNKKKFSRLSGVFGSIKDILKGNIQVG